MNLFKTTVLLAMYRAKQVSESESPRLHRIVKGLADKGGMPMPRIYIIPEESPNAFATGRDPRHAAVAATEGILRLLDDEELEGVMAHELMHVANRDTLTSSLFGVHPFGGRMAGLFSTHPPVEKRIERLEELARDVRRV